MGATGQFSLVRKACLALTLWVTLLTRSASRVGRDVSAEPLKTLKPLWCAPWGDPRVGHHRFDLDEVRQALGDGENPGALSLGALPERRHEIRRLARRHGAHNVRVVGSVARGEHKAGSDVDLLVDLQPGPTLFDVAALHDDLEERLGCPVGVITSGAARGRLARLVDDAVAL